ncbi:PREDICTED: uncharacterized protein LOC108552906 [Eufriesea mexicana]|uniref:uncharacterized protein LOC108552906 n=1 Tax=Eufriesea mexicana TaxID=516756 RepID=UPI00083C8AFC|nr:PREDICTED: uncharacterized protein LOC108552906 [Eufriesea mexicana]
MGDSLNERIDNLRKRSKLLLAQIDKNSKKVKDEFKKFNSQNLILKENSRNHGKINLPHSLIKKDNKSWKLRNDSSGVGGALRSDCFCNSPNQTSASMSNTSTAKKILTSSKKHFENQSSLENIYRKPVKECYCNTEIRKAQHKSTRTQHRPRSPCKKCRSHINFPAITIEDNFEKSTLSSPISCETLRRVQKIDYAPKSQFLRNVTSRVSLLQAATGDCPDTCFRSQCYHEMMAKKNVHDVGSIHQLKVDKRLEANHHSATSTLTKSKISEKYSSSGNESVEKCSKGIQVSLKKHSKPKVVRRTLSSKASVPDIKKTKSSSKVLTKSKKPVSSKECQCCHKNMPQQSKAVSEEEDSEKYKDSVCINKLENEIGREHVFDREMRELKKFREQNYFDTHGSSHTLSSKSSGSLEQYLLNDRLFAEPTKRIHKKDLVVTMPPCVTTQLKRMHYFPRYIVRQEKNNLNVNYKKKRCQTCPLTGHAIDLGVTKIRPPLNSLALKYQKRLP